MMAAAAFMVRPLPPYSSGISAARKPALVKRRDEFVRIGALAIERAPVFAGKIRAQRAHRLADRRELGGFRHDLTSARPLLTAITSRSTTRERKLTTVAVAPHLGAQGLAGKDRRGKAAGERDERCRIVSRRKFSARAWPATPKLPSPCMIGRG